MDKLGRRKELRIFVHLLIGRGVKGGQNKIAVIGRKKRRKIIMIREILPVGLETAFDKILSFYSRNYQPYEVSN